MLRKRLSKPSTQPPNRKVNEMLVNKVVDPVLAAIKKIKRNPKATYDKIQQLQAKNKRLKEQVDYWQIRFEEMGGKIIDKTRVLKGDNE